MRQLSKLLFIGIIAGTILASVLILVFFMTANEAYYMLFNVDYIPVLKEIQPRIIVEIAFHYAFCIGSVVGLFYILSLIQLEHELTLYILVYTGGSAILYFLTALSGHPPMVTDVAAWIYWSLAHAIYSVIVGLSIKKWT